MDSNKWWESDPVMMKIINDYYNDNARKLHKMVDMIFHRKFGGTADKNMDEFYSVGTDTFMDILAKHRFDESKGDFDGFFYRALELSIIDEYKRRGRNKRAAKVSIEEQDENGNKRIIKKIVPDVSIYEPINGTDGITYGEFIDSGFDTEKSVLNNSYGFTNERFLEYFNGLTKTQQEIVKMKMDNVSKQEIKKILNLSEKQYTNNFEALTSFERVCILKSKTNIDEFEEDEQMAKVTQTMEKSKPDRMSIAAINKKIDKHTILFNHPLQRESEQWSPSMKGNLISDILQENPIPALVFAEQVVNGIAIIWDLDGKQRCTNAYSFSKDGFKVSKNIRRWLIEYQAPVVDENGDTVFDENQFPIYERKEFDIRGKRFSELPEELQDRFNDYNFEIVQYLNCSSEDIAYHIARYNEGKPMTASQKGITRLGETYADMVKSISNMPFFKDMGGYKVSEFKNGTINRVVVESVMAAKYLDDWKKKQEDMCEYIKNNATTTDFDDFEDMVKRLETVVNDETADMFDSKDSFLWFGLFARFIKTGEDDKQFVEFMTEFSQSLHKQEIDGVSYDDLNGKSTKDKTVVISKMNHLETLLYDFLHIDNEDVKEVEPMQFVKENIDSDVTKDDFELYEMILNEKSELVEDLDSWIFSDRNRPALLALTAYAINKDEDNLLADWLSTYEKNNNFILNQKDAFLHMKADFENYINRKDAA